MTVDHVTPEQRAAWASVRERCSEGLDLTDPEDRATFRSRVQQATTGVWVSLVRAVAADLGAVRPGVPAHRVLADAWIGVGPGEVGAHRG